METKHTLKMNKYAWLAYIYFFFNSVGLPFGVLYMNLLTPFFYFRILLKKKKEILHPLLFFLIPFDIIHFMNGVTWKNFILSNLLFISTYIFVYAFYIFINSYQHTGKLFKRILIVNFIFTMIALFVFFTPYRESMWYINKFTNIIFSYILSCPRRLSTKISCTRFFSKKISL